MYHKKLSLICAIFVTCPAPLMGSLRVINIENLLRKPNSINFKDNQALNAFRHYALYATNNLKRLYECFSHIYRAMKHDQKLPQEVADLKIKVNQRIIASIGVEALQNSKAIIILKSLINKQETLEPLCTILELLEKVHDETNESINKAIRSMHSKTLSKMFFLALQSDQALQDFMHFFTTRACRETAIKMRDYLQNPAAPRFAQQYQDGDTRLGVMRNL